MERDVPNTRRRNIVNWLLGGSVAGLVASVVYPLARFVSPPEVPEAATDQYTVNIVRKSGGAPSSIVILRS
ncbi:MAG: hypothetical protein P8Z74_03985 [Acidobacteriota bacterium]